MSFLRQQDYSRLIRQDNLKVIIEDNAEVLKGIELAVQAEVESYIRHRYDVSKIFINISAYNAATAYLLGDLIVFPDIEDNIFSAVEDQTGISPDDDPTKWTAGDTRSQLILMHMIDIAIYHIHSRINPRNIPDFRIERRDDAITWLKMIAKGDITTDLPTLQDDDGNELGLTIRQGSNEKFNHTY